ncbi:MAG: outer membrane protein assembly factor BamE [Gammaproteobacteria bacterium]|nr:outer membrane protein assembly factor BamE [Gammaproteobacteria bacterium]
MKATINNGPRPLRPTLSRRVRAVTAVLLLPAALAACVYRMPIQQGNFLDPVVIAQVQPGMTQSQVRYLLGTPMVPPNFDSSRWDYYYYLKERRMRAPRVGHVTVHFRDELVERVESSVKDSSEVPLSTRPVAAPNT